MIKFEHVSVQYKNADGRYALNDVSMEIKDGEFVFLTGPSGAGKSTIMKLLLREETPKTGTILVDDYDLNSLKTRKIPFYRRNLGIVFQDYKLFEKSTVYENVAFAMRAVGAPSKIIRKRVEGILDILDIKDKYNKFPHQLSGGERQRVAVARAVVNNPSIIIADEATSNLDIKLRNEIMQILTGFNNSGKTVIVITHDLSIVEKFNKRVITLNKGELVSDTKNGGVANE
ncbi:MAG: cell division ATP-binding protein FtsE [Clostridia bacterium]|nr:cell division ATP-binding protein FtsE [Clostridia bacterium]